MSSAQKREYEFITMILQWMGEFERIDREQKNGMMVRNLQAYADRALMGLDGGFLDMDLRSLLKLMETAASMSNVEPQLEISGDVDPDGLCLE